MHFYDREPRDLMDTPVQHIVFDVGQVLLRYNPELAFVSVIPDEEERRHFLENICTPAWNVEQDRGRSWQEAEDELIALHPDRGEHIRAYRRNWHRMIPGAIEENVAIVETLVRQGRDVTLLTNFAADTFAEASKRFPFLEVPRGATVSGDFGRIKPEPEIYRFHAERFNLEPAAILFIDDSAANVAAARGAGWRAEQYVETSRLLRDLQAHGISV
jgi:2-haloacid dehalogenase